MCVGFRYYDDNQGSAQLSQNPVSNLNSKHIDVGPPFLRDLAHQGGIYMRIFFLKFSADLFAIDLTKIDMFCIYLRVNEVLTQLGTCTEQRRIVATLVKMQDIFLFLSLDIFFHVLFYKKSHAYTKNYYKRNHVENQLDSQYVVY